ncbi:iron-containing alcohol dehydrogenase, partial [Alicyclobacillus sp.]|uniref:iron-containing alcohol dehydrogenase n=1 Tax=Alicyclobacillus sp. TaxID=61169 RepID=UPI0025BB4F99
MFYPLYCRGYQAVMRATSKMLAWREPEVIRGAHALSQLPAAIRERGVERVLVVTDRGVQAAGILNEVLDGLRRQGIYAVVYDETVPNPTIGNIEDALAVYHGEACKGIVAVGGGSPMDCAKGVGARVARPDRTIPQMKGLFKVRRRMPPLFAVPTTAGTGSEATLAAVVSNPKTREKYALMDTALIPDVAVLDPTLTLGLPRQVTATTGMDALTHAVEAYIGRSNTPYTEQCSREAVRIIFQSLVHV